MNCPASTIPKFLLCCISGIFEIIRCSEVERNFVIIDKLFRLTIERERDRSLQFLDAHHEDGCRFVGKITATNVSTWAKFNHFPAVTETATREDAPGHPSKDPSFIITQRIKVNSWVNTSSILTQWVLLEPYLMRHQTRAIPIDG